MSLLGLLFAASVFAAFANGANDNFKGVATLYGSGALSYRQALAWATLTTVAGSLCAIPLSQGLVARFGGEGLVGQTVASDPAFASAVGLGAAGTVLLATRLGFPISTTHALTGALVGAGMVAAGPGQISYATLGAAFALPLLTSPLLAMALAGILYAALRDLRLRLGVDERTCVCLGGVEQIATYLPGSGAVLLSSGRAVAIDSLERCERRYAGTVLGFDAQSVLNRLHVLSGGAVGFARGLNDTPKIVALMVTAQALRVPSAMTLAAAAMAAGGLVAARRVARTMSFKITPMNHGQGFSASLVTALLVSMASPLGLPVSTTHVSCGAIFGIGAINREARWSIVLQILSSWVTTLPVAAVLAAGAARLAIALR